MRKAWQWIRKHATAILAVVVSVVAAVLGIEYARRKLAGAADQAEVERARREIAALQARRDKLLEEVDARDERVAEIDAQLLENKRAIVAAHEDVAKMSDAEVLDAFERLGYILPLLISLRFAADAVC